MKIQTLEESMHALNFTQPYVVPITDRLYRLGISYTYTWTTLRCRADQSMGCTWQRITIPEGFVYDGATVPRWLWTLIGMTPDGLHRAAALMHDWMYAHRGFLPSNSYEISLDNGKTWEYAYGKWTRKATDLLFRKLLRE